MCLSACVLVCVLHLDVLALVLGVDPDFRQVLVPAGRVSNHPRQPVHNNESAEPSDKAFRRRQNPESKSENHRMQGEESDGGSALPLETERVTGEENRICRELGGDSLRQRWVYQRPHTARPMLLSETRSKLAARPQCTAAAAGGSGRHRFCLGRRRRRHRACLAAAAYRSGRRCCRRARGLGEGRW